MIHPFEKNWKINFRDYFKEDLTQLQPLLEDDLITLNEETLASQDLGHLFLRNIAMAFDSYLDKIKKTAKTPTFSQTV